jgi:hypothetical protein
MEDGRLTGVEAGMGSNMGGSRLAGVEADTWFSMDDGLDDGRLAGVGAEMWSSRGDGWLVCVMADVPADMVVGVETVVEIIGKLVFFTVEEFVIIALACH